MLHPQFSKPRRQSRLETLVPIGIEKWGRVKWRSHISTRPNFLGQIPQGEKKPPAEPRLENTRQETEYNRYKLVEQKSPAKEKEQP
jgi:hypothetical protein